MGRARVRGRQEWRHLNSTYVIVHSTFDISASDVATPEVSFRASGLVMETGGFLSHGAAVAREYRIPAAVNIPGILGQLADGERVVVGGDDGRVHRPR